MQRPPTQRGARLAAVLSLAAASCGGGAPTEPTMEPAAEPDLGALALELGLEEATLERALQMSPLPPPPSAPTNAVADSSEAAHYGRFLFFDERFSRDGSVSCATCHEPGRAFTDGKPVAFGLAEGNRRTPTLWNVAYHRWLTWDGRADSLWMQALDPLEDPREMDATRVGAVRLVALDAELREAHESIFGALEISEAEATAWPARARPARDADEGEPPEVTAWNALAEEDRGRIDRVFVELGKAIAAYQRLLVRGEADFDRFVAALRTGEPEGLARLDVSARRGMELFLGRGNCVLCHNGPNFSDGEFHNNSLPTRHGGPRRDPGRYRGAEVVKASEFNAAGPYSDDREGEDARAVRLLRTGSETWGEFRTPSLRNLAGREPFMHQGQLEDLDAVLEFYSTLEGGSGRNHHQERLLVPLDLTAQERADLKAFLGALEGAAAPGELLAPPPSPAGPSR